MIRLVVEGIQKADHVLAFGFSLPASDLHVCAALGTIDWSGKKLGLVFRSGPNDSTATNWKRVAQGATAVCLSERGFAVDSLDEISKFWKSINEFLR